MTEPILFVEKPIADRCLEAIIAVCDLPACGQKSKLIDCLLEVIDLALNPPFFIGGKLNDGTDNDQTSPCEETAQG